MFTKKDITSVLDGLRVLDVSQVAAVPLAARLLADFGADVIHIEHPIRGDSFRQYQAGIGAGTSGAPSNINYNWENYNRNKRSLAVDLSRRRGREIMYNLVKGADVFLTNLRQFELQKFGMEYEALNKLNTGLIYGSLSGYGKKGQEKDAPGYDQTAYWYRAGIPHVIFWPDEEPPPFQTGFGDNVAALALAFGVMTALFIREKTGLGREVDLSLFQMGVFVNSFNISGTLTTGRDSNEWSRPSRENFPNPLANIYQTKDNRWLSIVMLQPDRYWSKFCKAIEREDLENDLKFKSFDLRKENRVSLFHILEEVFRSKPLVEWKSRFTEAGIPFAPMQNLLEVIQDPQAIANDFFFTVNHPNYGEMKLLANPVHLSEASNKLWKPAPELGQHTEEILLETGYTWEDITALKDEEVI